MSPRLNIFRSTAALLLALLLAASLPATARAAIVDPIQALPESAVFYAAISDPGVLLDALLDPRLHEDLRALYAVGPDPSGAQLRRAAQAVALVELRLGKSWQQIARDLLGGSIHLAVDLRSAGPLLVVQTRNAETLHQLHALLVELAEQDAARRGRPSPVESKDYRGYTGWTFGGKQYHVLVDDLLILSNRSDALQAAIDRIVDGSPSLAASATFQQARRLSQPGSIAWSMLDLQAARQAPRVAQALAGGANHPLAELVLGGLFEAASQAPFATASLRLDEGRWRLLAEVPFQPSAPSPRRKWLFADTHAAAAPRPLELPGAIATLVAYRDLAGMWMSRQELFDARTNAAFEQADTNLGLFFSGRDFGPEVLGALGPRWQVIVASRDDSADQSPAPALRLPAAAVVAEVADEKLDPTFQLAFQNLLGVVNLQAIQQGRPQWLLTHQQHAGRTIAVATLVPPQGAPPQGAGVEYNFSPAMVLADGRLILGSTRSIVTQCLDALAQAGDAPIADNVAFALDGRQLLAALEANRQLVESRHMLAQGRSREDSQRDIDRALELARRFRSLAARLSTAGDVLRLEVSLDISRP